MRICIVIQSDAFRTSAGMRIRYDRFQDNLGDSDASIEAITAAELAASKTLEHDVYVFCKTFDVTALLLARRMKAAGKTVGQDFFDDYFSQYSDQRLHRFRNWLRDMAPVTDFAVCSTPRMAEVLSAYLPGVRISAIEDPVSGFDAASVGRLADAKVTAASTARKMDVVWFGIGDNPYFPVGLIDLAACEGPLAQIERAGWNVHLRIVTNRRPFKGRGAEVLRRIGVGYELVEWSEEIEREALESAAVALLPVNAQSFSRAKSMNRAVTALSAGCQVLSLGYPLYGPLDDFIYRSAGDLVADLEADAARVGGERIDGLAARLAELADPRHAAEAFVAEARLAHATVSGKEPEKRLVCLIHGRNSAIANHKSVGAIGGLSVGTFYNKSSWNFPVRFDRLGREVVMRTTPAVAEKYELPVREGDRPRRVLDLEFVRIDTPSLGLPEFYVDLPDATHAIQGLPVYEDVIRFAAECCRRSFPAADILVADTSPFALRLRDLRKALPARRLRKPRGLSGGIQWNRLKPGSKRKARSEDASRALRLLLESGLFEAAWYLKQYPDVAASGIDPARHFLDFGWREGRNPGPGFATRDYLKLYPDVAEQGTNPLLHFVEYGEAEGRTAPRVRTDPVGR